MDVHGLGGSGRGSIPLKFAGSVAKPFPVFISGNQPVLASRPLITYPRHPSATQAAEDQRQQSAR